MGIFKKKKTKDVYRVVEVEQASLTGNQVSPYYYYTVEKKGTDIFGREKWRPVRKRTYNGMSTKTWSTEKEAEAWIKLKMYKTHNRVVKVYESREDKINTILNEK